MNLLPKDTNFAFNLSHVKFVKKEKKCLIHDASVDNMNGILCYLNTIEAVKLT